MKNKQIVFLAKEAVTNERKLGQLIKLLQKKVRYRYPYYQSKTTCMDFDDFDAIAAAVIWENLSKLGLDSWVGYVLRIINRSIQDKIRQVEYRSPKTVFIDEFFKAATTPVYLDDSEGHYVFLVAEIAKRLKRQSRALQLFRLMMSFPNYTHRRLATIMEVHETRVCQLMELIRKETEFILQTN